MYNGNELKRVAAAPMEDLKEELIAMVSLLSDKDCADILQRLRERGVLFE